MADFTLHTLETAPEGSRETLQGIHDFLGFIPNTYATLAESPAALRGAFSLFGLLGEGAFSSPERQFLWLAIGQALESDYCIAAHRGCARNAGLPDNIIEAVLDGTPIPDDRFAALHAFLLRVMETRGQVTAADQGAFFAAGFTRAHALEVIACLALKTLSGYAGRLAGTPVDPQMEPGRWEALLRERAVA